MTTTTARVSYHKATGKWQAYTYNNGKQKYLGIYKSRKQAQTVSQNGKRSPPPGRKSKWTIAQTNIIQYEYSTNGTHIRDIARLVNMTEEETRNKIIHLKLTRPEGYKLIWARKPLKPPKNNHIRRGYEVKFKPYDLFHLKADEFTTKYQLREGEYDALMNRIHNQEWRLL